MISFLATKKDDSWKNWAYQSMGMPMMMTTIACRTSSNIANERVRVGDSLWMSAAFYLNGRMTNTQVLQPLFKLSNELACLVNAHVAIDNHMTR